MQDIIFLENDELSKDENYRKSVKIKIIKKKLEELSQDFIQMQCGAVFEDKETRVKEFQELHNELRILLEKKPRMYNM